METVLGYIDAGKKEGAQVVAGGGRANVGSGKGYFVEPTIFDGVTNTMKIAREEIFGPVLSGDPVQVDRRGHRPGQRDDLRSGRRGVDARRHQGAHGRHARSARAPSGSTPTTCSTPALPFGGFKESGFGRELGSAGLEQLHRDQDRLGRSLVARVRRRRAPRGTGLSPQPAGAGARASATPVSHARNSASVWVEVSM